MPKKTTKKPGRRARFSTPSPSITPEQLAFVRMCAKRWIMAGGGVVLHDIDDHSVNDYIANVRQYLKGTPNDEFSATLDREVPNFDAHARVESAALTYIAAEAESGFSFGVQVGLEMAAMLFGRQTPDGAR